MFNNSVYEGTCHNSIHKYKEVGTDILIIQQWRNQQVNYKYLYVWMFYRLLSGVASAFLKHNQKNFLNIGKAGLQLRSLTCPRDALPEIGQLELGSVGIKFQFFGK